MRRHEEVHLRRIAEKAAEWWEAAGGECESRERMALGQAVDDYAEWMEDQQRSTPGQ